MERVRIGKDIVFQWEVRKDGAALTAEDAANLTLEIAGRNGKSQRLPFEIRDSKIIAAWYGVRQTEIGAYRLTCWHNRGKVGESVVDVVWAVELVRYTTEETFDDIETVTIELEGGNLAFAALKGASAYEVAVAEGFVGTEAEWVASLKKPAEDAAEDAEEAAQRAINAAVEATESAENAQTEAGNARAAGDYAYEMANNAATKAQLADAAADNANTAATEAYSKAQEAGTAATTATNAAQSANSAATTATNAAQSANSAAASANEAANSAVNAAVEATESAENAQTEAGNARAAGDYAYEMAIAAERVNAQLNGNVLTVTNRQGVSESVNTKGEQGEQGNPGQAATISVGTTATGAPGTNAQVTNSGTSSAAVLDFTIPQGAKGDKGDQGEPGEVTEAELTEKLAAKANTDGYYSRMVVGGAESLIGDVPQTATYTFRRTGGGAIGEPVARLTEVQGNTGCVNQQCNIVSQDQSKSQNGVTLTDNRDGSYSVVTGSEGATANTNLFLFITSATVAGHKYFVKGCPQGGSTTTYEMKEANGRLSGEDVGSGFIATAASSGASSLNVKVVQGTIISTPVVFWPQRVDLTLMYGAGYEPATVAEFEARIWRDYGKTLDEYVAYTQGKLINCKAVALESVGQNQWDEEWELGAIDLNTGEPKTANNQIRSKNYISIIGGESYCASSPNTSTFGVYVMYYDANKDAIIDPNAANKNYKNTAYQSPNNAHYAKFYCSAGYGTTYKNDICINISDAAVNGTYRPCKKDVVNFDLSTMTGINPTTGVRETIFSNGMRSKGDVRDVISGNTATVRIGDPTQEAPLENTVLATPIIYTDLQYADGTPFVLPKNFEVQNDGTERITHAEGEDSIAPVMSAIYGLNAVGFVQDAPKDYTSQATLDGLIAKISAITGTTITKTWDAANNKWTFS